MSRLEATRGFTLIEVMVALALAGSVLLMGHAILSQIYADWQKLTAASVQMDRKVNGARFLRSLLNRVQSVGNPLHQFSGHSTAVSFRSWCEAPAGWLEECEVTLSIAQTGGETMLAISTGNGEVILLPKEFGARRLIYLGDVEHKVWLSRWSSGSILPIALGVVVSGDTVIYPVRGEDQ
jgi:prepilin-type N-terminal cleavage/methylation domain-containing protein